MKLPFITLLAQTSVGTDPDPAPLTPWEGFATITVLVLGALAVVGIVFLFLYLTGRLVKSTVDTAGDVASTVFKETGGVLREGIETTGRVAETTVNAIAGGTGALGRALLGFAQKPSSQSLYLAFCEARPSFEVITCRMSSSVVSRFPSPETPKGVLALGRNRAIVEVMPVEVCYGFDMTAFRPENIQYDHEAQQVRVELPPLKVLSLKKERPAIIFDNYGKLSREEQHRCQDLLDKKMEIYAKSETALRLAEETSVRAFQEILNYLFLLIDPSVRPLDREIVPYPRDKYELLLPEPLKLEAHHAPEPPGEDEDDQQDDEAGKYF